MKSRVKITSDDLLRKLQGYYAAAPENDPEKQMMHIERYVIPERREDNVHKYFTCANQNTNIGRKVNISA